MAHLVKAIFFVILVALQNHFSYFCIEGIAIMAQNNFSVPS